MTETVSAFKTKIEDIIFDRTKSGDKPLDIYLAIQGQKKVEDEIFDVVFKFLKDEKTASSARQIGNFGKKYAEFQMPAANILGGFLTDHEMNEDIRRTATVELGSIAKKLNEALTNYSSDIDEKENTENLIRILSMLEKGVHPQVSRVIEPIVMETKSPAVTTKTLQILLNAQHREAAEVLDKVLDHKQDYDTQKITAIAEAVSHVEDMQPESLKIISDYFNQALPEELRKLEKSIEKFQGLGKVASAFAKVDAISRDDAASMIKAGRQAMQTIQELSDKSDIFNENLTVEESVLES